MACTPCFRHSLRPSRLAYFAGVTDRPAETIRRGLFPPEGSPSAGAASVDALRGSVDARKGTVGDTAEALAQAARSLPPGGRVDSMGAGRRIFDRMTGSLKGRQENPIAAALASAASAKPSKDSASSSEAKGGRAGREAGQGSESSGAEAGQDAVQDGKSGTIDSSQEAADKIYERAYENSRTFAEALGLAFDRGEIDPHALYGFLANHSHYEKGMSAQWGSDWFDFIQNHGPAGLAAEKTPERIACSVGGVQVLLADRLGSHRGQGRLDQVDNVMGGYTMSGLRLWAQENLYAGAKQAAKLVEAKTGDREPYGSLGFVQWPEAEGNPEWEGLAQAQPAKSASETNPFPAVVPKAAPTSSQPAAPVEQALASNPDSTPASQPQASGETSPLTEQPKPASPETESAQVDPVAENQLVSPEALVDIEGILGHAPTRKELLSIAEIQRQALEEGDALDAGYAARLHLIMAALSESQIQAIEAKTGIPFSWHDLDSIQDVGQSASRILARSIPPENAIDRYIRGNENGILPGEGRIPIVMAPRPSEVSPERPPLEPGVARVPIVQPKQEEAA